MMLASRVAEMKEKQQERRKYRPVKRPAALHMHRMCLPGLWTVAMAVIVAAAVDPAIYVANDGVLHIGDNETNMQVRVGGVDILELQQQISLIKSEQQQQIRMLQAENRFMSQQIYKLTWRDAVFEQKYKLAASDGASIDMFGTSVSVAGDLLAVGAYGDDDYGSSSGSVYVFEKNGVSGVFEEKYKLAASDAVATDVFGYSVFVDGDLLFVGAIYDDDQGTDSGSIYVFERNSSSGVFEEKYKLTASDGAGDDWFGSSVSVAGDLLFVGAEGDDGQVTDSGSVYMFEKNNVSGVFEEKYKLTASDGASDDRFGISVCITGDLLFVGAMLDDDKGADSGSVYVFEKNSVSGVFEEKHKLSASDGAGGDWFGRSVSVDGDLLFVGANGGDGGSGSVYVFEKNNVSGVFEQKYKLSASDGAKSDHFGTAVSCSGGVLFVGATGDDGKATDSGSVYVFSLP